MSTELKFIGIGLFSMLITGIFLQSFFPSENVSVFDRQQYINDITNEMGSISGFITSSLLNIGIEIFELFGIDFISASESLPLWVVSILSLYVTFLTFVTLFYLVDRLWIG